MRKTIVAANKKVSVSLTALVARQDQKLAYSPAATASGVMTRGDTKEIDDRTEVAALVEVDDAAHLIKTANFTGMSEVLQLNDSLVSVLGTPRSVSSLAGRKDVRRVEAEKEKSVLLDSVPREIGLCIQPRVRTVAEDGKGVAIGVVDSGFDLSHPSFRDASGRLCVDALFDQVENRFYNTDELEGSWRSGAGPGDDLTGHGTHVASIAAGRASAALAEGVAPGARLILVKTNWVRTAAAVSWIFARANELNLPCVVNLSLGHHLGPHDGSNVEERAYDTITSVPGRVIVVAAGNERDSAIHIGGNFHAGQEEEVTIDLLRQVGRQPSATVTIWHHARDAFEFELLSPSHDALPFPGLNSVAQYASSTWDVDLALKEYAWSVPAAKYAQLQIGLSKDWAGSPELRGWKLRIRCVEPFVGRIDGWVNNSGYGEFRSHRLVDSNSTVGLPGTGEGTITVASYVSKNAWQADGGAGLDNRAVVGRASSFSSRGPTRDGRWKPDIAAPGQYVTAALAQRSRMTELEERALVDARCVTVEGTSMAAPVAAGIVALLLQKRPAATARRIAEVLRESSRRDAHTGPALWSPSYGYGKIDVAKALQMI
jgi:subtilisin family serine protease